MNNYQAIWDGFMNYLNNNQPLKATFYPAYDYYYGGLQLFWTFVLFAIPSAVYLKNKDMGQATILFMVLSYILGPKILPQSLYLVYVLMSAGIAVGLFLLFRKKSTL